MNGSVLFLCIRIVLHVNFLVSQVRQHVLRSDFGKAGYSRENEQLPHQLPAPELDALRAQEQNENDCSDESLVLGPNVAL